MYSVFMQKFMLSMNVQRQFHWPIQRYALPLLYSRSFVKISFIETVLQQAREGTCESQSTSLDLALISISIPFHCMKRRAQGRAAVKANAPQGVEFKCAHCNGEFGSRRAMECHRRHAKSVGTPCADPRSFKSLSFTGRLRQHDAGTLGLSNHTPTPQACLFNWRHNSFLH